jgi:energy-coupling factor transporter ATP-binding protein EcfA2
MEEIPIDCVYKGAGDWQIAFQSHGFPRLLLNARRVLRINNRADVDKWSAADALVENELRSFAVKFTDRTQRELATTVEREVERLKSRGPASSAVRTARRFNRIGARNFRNIREAALEIGAEPVSCLVLTGPNGSGKSTLFEVLSLATFGSSSRYLDYLRDKDASSRGPGDYISKYLQNISNPDWGAPELVLDGEVVKIALPQSEVDAAAIDRLSEGSLFSQERSSKFCQRNASDLAGEVLGGYSDIANGIQWYVDDEFQKANRGRQDLLRSLGLNASITKVETAQQQVAVRQLTNGVPFPVSNLMAWLKIDEN